MDVNRPLRAMGEISVRYGMSAIADSEEAIPTMNRPMQMCSTLVAAAIATDPKINIKF